MLFCSQNFLLFFLAVFVVYWALPWQRARVWLLLACSFVFYATWNRWLACIICVTTLADYVIAILLESSATPTRKKLLLFASVGMNLALLCYFKYVNFFLHSIEGALNAAGAGVSLPTLSVILPIGISFYTFEAISYTVDVYRGRIKAERNLGHFMLFILFFPHLIAGPIVRAADFLPQIRRAKHWQWTRARVGLQLFFMGMIKKIVIADRLAAMVDPVFAHASDYGTGTTWTIMIAWAIQVYCDFSGYSDMALGCAHLLGYRLTQNFDMPYLAVNISDFWRRWHMSLGSWLRDYLFIPLGGSRAGLWITCRNLLITMTLCGLWHGASWTFVLFGFLQALLLIGHVLFRRFCEARPSLDEMLHTPVGAAMRIALTFATFCITLVVFRAQTLSIGWGMLQTLFVPRADKAVLATEAG
ncbi:MAG TPA: MBOAT family O-acyltransferase, partial [Gemmataceae bacterium]|nr:MBOAT family O-acyltransferase [Gemmataceae bacterium]